MNAKLERAIERLYEVFKEYPFDPNMNTCPHCKLEGEKRKLGEKTLKELTWEDLGIYHAKAITTFGEIEDYKHFLPRICELHVLDIDNEPLGMYILFGKLEYAKLEEWPEKEKEAVHIFLRAWTRSLRGWRREDAVDAWKERSELIYDL